MTCVGQPIEACDADLIHLFAPGENFPCCRVEPIDSRQVDMALERGGRYTFRAGRNGVILGTATCQVREEGRPGDVFQVLWSQGTLECDETFGTGWAR